MESGFRQLPVTVEQLFDVPRVMGYGNDNDGWFTYEVHDSVGTDLNLAETLISTR
jgi:hypothetical protein